MASLLGIVRDVMTRSRKKPDLKPASSPRPINGNPWLSGLSELLESPPPPQMSVAEMLAKGINPFLHGLTGVPAPSHLAGATIEPPAPPKTKTKKTRRPKPVAQSDVKMAEPMPDVFTNLAAAAAYIGVSKRTILNWKRDGWLKVEQVGRKIRIAKADLDQCKRRQ